jgi:DNA-binding FrmR family transcriptional regulator
MTEVVHQTHPAIVKRLKRAEGHLRNVIGMMESARPCLELTQQLHAVESALKAAKKALIHDHIDHCLVHAADDQPAAGQDSLDELKALTKYL